eukprot:COSAG01_NODE_6262_length_3765_cov_2.735406_1_plen_86_part_00
MCGTGRRQNAARRGARGSNTASNDDDDDDDDDDGGSRGGGTSCPSALPCRALDTVALCTIWYAVHAASLERIRRRVDYVQRHSGG